MVSFAIKKGVARPTPAPQQNIGQNKYPTALLEVNEHYIVPASERKEGESDYKFRNRINQAVRSYMQKVNRDAALLPDWDEKTYQGPEFSVILLGAPDAEKGEDWAEGDIGVWRDR